MALRSGTPKAVASHDTPKRAPRQISQARLEAARHFCVRRPIRLSLPRLCRIIERPSRKVSRRFHPVGVCRVTRHETVTESHEKTTLFAAASHEANVFRALAFGHDCKWKCRVRQTFAASSHTAFSCHFVRFSCPAASPRPEGRNDALPHREGRQNRSSGEDQPEGKCDLQARVTVRHFSGVAARRCSGLWCIGRRPGRERSHYI